MEKLKAAALTLSTFFIFILILSLSVSQCAYKDCDMQNNKWCDSTLTWQTSNYCTDSVIGCGYKDADCFFIINACNQNSCDTYAKKYCSASGWTTIEYCDISHCKNLDSSYCSSCTKTETLENTCNDDLDNDCDAYFDCNDPDCAGRLGCECSEGETKQCGTTDIGECTYAFQTCISGSWSECTAVLPSNELCEDNKDNDCDNQVDEDNCKCISSTIRICGSDIGACHAGIQTCGSEGVWSVCYGSSYSPAGIETCDGMDNDCDGEIDETCSCISGAGQSCGSDIGICTKGTQTCINGSWSSCSGSIQPVIEICDDKLDNDCDGLTDSEDEFCASNTTMNASQQVQTAQPSCSDKIQNQNEEEIDCGGICIPCSETEEIAQKEQTIEPKQEEYKTIVFFILALLIIIIALTAAIYLFSKKRAVLKQKSIPKSLPKPPVKPAIKKTLLEHELEKIR
ncbi:hypothetical protein HZB88_00645 [archaeon]|nr:hypothetical protein [archaeon]